MTPPTKHFGNLIIFHYLIPNTLVKVTTISSLGYHNSLLTGFLVSSLGTPSTPTQGKMLTAMVSILKTNPITYTPPVKALQQLRIIALPDKPLHTSDPITWLCHLLFSRFSHRSRFSLLRVFASVVSNWNHFTLAIYKVSLRKNIIIQVPALSWSPSHPSYNPPI